jgi:FkbM family methyltransferase
MNQTGLRRGALTARVLERRLWGDVPFRLLDVGCSGGIDARWHAFGDLLHAVGFDPLVAEIERLNATNEHPGITYEAAFVTCRNYDQLFPPELRNDPIASRNNDPFPRVSAAAAQSRLQVSFVQEVFNSGADVVLTDRVLTLDDYVGADHRAEVDFVKIDTDGHDIEVILGAESIVAAGGLIGLLVEAPYHGPTHEFANVFSNIDRILRRWGFTLFNITTNRYSRTQLPAPFLLDLAAQTTFGQVVWGDALYFRDIGFPHYERLWPAYSITRERVLKLACLFDIFNLPDCAAELLINRGDFFTVREREELLDLLASGGPGSYAAHVAEFERDFTSFYRSRIAERNAPPPQGLAATPRSERNETPSPQEPREPHAKPEIAAKTVVRLRNRLRKLSEKNAVLRDRLRVGRDRLEQLTKRVEQLESRRRH